MIVKLMIKIKYIIKITYEKKKLSTKGKGLG